MLSLANIGHELPRGKTPWLSLIPYGKRVQKKNMSKEDIEYAKWLKQSSDDWFKWAMEYKTKLDDLDDYLKYIILTNKI
jgi:hypothetical protein